MFYRALSHTPLFLLHALAYLLYLVIYYIAGYRKAVVFKNLRAAFPDESETEITKTAQKFYRQLADVALEIVKARTLPAEELKRRVRLLNPEILMKYADQGQSVILLTIHKCNWEWMLHGVSLHLGLPIDAVYKPLHNKRVDALIYEIRCRFGSQPVAMEQASRKVLLGRREFRIFAMIADQSPIPRERSYWTRFMNQDAAFYLGSEKLAKATEFPVLFVSMNRTARGYYEATFSELATPPYDKLSNDILDAYVQAAETSIAEQPESWLWSNRRWKHVRPD